MARLPTQEIDLWELQQRARELGCEVVTREFLEEVRKTMGDSIRMMTEITELRAEVRRLSRKRWWQRRM